MFEIIPVYQRVFNGVTFADDFVKEIRDRGLIYVDGSDDEDKPIFSNAY